MIKKTFKAQPRTFKNPKNQFSLSWKLALRVLNFHHYELMCYAFIKFAK